LVATHQVNRVAALAVSAAEMLEFGKDYMGQIAEDWNRPSGLRMGTIEATRLGMREEHMETIADFMARILVEKETPSRVVEDVIEFRLPYQKLYYCFDNGLPGE
jgi:glycine hydroxymethyltransferase